VSLEGVASQLDVLALEQKIVVGRNGCLGNKQTGRRALCVLRKDEHENPYTGTLDTTQLFASRSTVLQFL